MSKLCERSVVISGHARGVYYRGLDTWSRALGVMGGGGGYRIIIRDLQGDSVANDSDRYIRLMRVGVTAESAEISLP